VTAPIVYVDTSAVCSGRLAELGEAMTDLTDFVQANEPRLLAYYVCFSPDRAWMKVVHVSPDSAALHFHLDVAGAKFAPIGTFINLQAIDVYGTPDEAVVTKLRAKACALGRAVVRVHPPYVGFSRLPPG